MLSGLRQWIFDRVVWRLFRRNFDLHYTFEPNLVYQVINVHARTRVPLQMDEQGVREQLALEIAHDLLAHGLVKIKVSRLDTVADYAAHLLVMRK